MREATSDLVTDVTRHAGRVRRYHTWVVHHQQTVGEHCWQVALVYEQVWGPLRAEVERYIRHHDTAELVVGDPPFPVKANNPELKAGYDALEGPALERLGVALPVLTAEERVKVKVADLLEMMVLGMTEREMGNLLAAPVVTRTERAAYALLADRYPAGRMLVDTWVRAQWERHERVLRNGDVNHDYSAVYRSQCV